MLHKIRKSEIDQNLVDAVSKALPRLYQDNWDMRDITLQVMKCYMNTPEYRAEREILLDLDDWLDGFVEEGSWLDSAHKRLKAVLKK